MSRFGRDRTFEKKMTVESCAALDTRIFELRSGIHTGGILRWGENSIRYELDTQDLADSWVNFSSTLSVTKEKVEYRVALVTTRLPSGGLRWWFICPLITDGKACRARVKKLYLPPGGRYFGCRRCYALTYASCQSYDGRFDRFRKELFG